MSMMTSQQRQQQHLKDIISEPSTSMSTEEGVPQIQNMVYTTGDDDDNDADDDAPDDDDGDKSITSYQTDELGDDNHRTGNNNNQRSAVAKERDVIARQEERAVILWKLVLVAVLVVSAIAVSLAVSSYISNQQKIEFHSAFDADAEKVLESIGTTLEASLGATDAFIFQLVAYSRYSNNTWPFVTMPSFAIHATKLLKLSKAFHFSLNIFVTPEDRDDWEEYANRSDGWIEENFNIQAGNTDSTGPIAEEFATSYKIFDYSQPNHTKPYDYMGTFCPSWQAYPLASSSDGGIIYNFDVWQIPDIASAMVEADKMKRVILSPAVNAIYDPNSEESIANAKGQSIWASAFIDTTEQDPHEPFSVITFPIYDSLEGVRVNVSDPNLPYVGVIIISIYWKQLVRAILPDTEDVVVVFEDSCSPPFTYTVRGKDAIYLGQGDLHNKKYDAMVQSASLHELVSPSDGSSYTGLPISETYCPRRISVYPSPDQQGDYMNSDPVVFAVTVSSIFLFTSLVFMVYDFWVNRRQRKVMHRALASGAIVSSLFPQKVRDQLYAEKDQESKAMCSRFREFATGSNNDVKPETSLTTSRPIADHFEETTILFADIRGFTKWSSGRSPVEVFVLLEGIYGRFDQIALRRKVFKVETIGDCYVSVTGIPEPQKHHATIMARFAHDCLVELTEVLESLSETLGEDTRNLTMRVGIHSGSVTAGVLRGEKGRFQLFGDSVNTAARMESNGEAGLIQCSEATADCLRKSGKEFWLIPRKDHIEVKGKGMMQTYWVQVEPRSRKADNVIVA